MLNDPELKAIEKRAAEAGLSYDPACIVKSQQDIHRLLEEVRQLRRHMSHAVVELAPALGRETP